MQKLSGKVALVTGATRGIGKGIAIGLAEAGATVYITGRSLDTSSAGEEIGGSLLATAAAVEEVGGKCIAIQIDHSDDEQVERLFEQINDEQQGQLDVLVNNAYGGVQNLRDNNGKPFWESDLSLWDACHQVGLRSHYIASVFAAKLMTKRKQGLICTISSWGSLSYLFGVAYSTGKVACDRLAADMAVELKSANVASLSIWPGIVGTEHITSIAKDNNAENPLLLDQYNWETPLLTGRAIASLAAEPEIMSLTGTIQIVAEVAKKYNLVDANGELPVSLRSLRFVFPWVWPSLREYSYLIPDVYFPWFILLLTRLQSPRIK